MKKLFFFIPALLLSLLANAAVINITPTSPHSSNNLRQAIAAAATGDIIEMAAGTYVETGDWIAFDDKEITVRAAEGAEVIIKPQFSVRVKAPNAPAKAEFIGVKFDCSTLESSELFVASADNANQKVVLDNCELYDWSNNNALIHSKSDRRLDVIDINNCYFHGFEKSIVFLENANLVSLSITNSTFANIAGASEYYAAPIDVRATSGDVLVDHCTFYNVNSMSLSYGVVNVTTITDPIVSNCIFMLPTSIDRCATYLGAGGDVKNCLTFNYDNWQPYGHYNTATVTDCFKADPLFTDAANGDFSLAGNWITMNLSPARGAATDGSDLGDPRWYSDETLPSTSFASAYDLIGTKALLTGDIELNASDHIKYKGTSTPGTAKWKLHVGKMCVINAVVDIESGSTNGRQLTLTVKDADGNNVGSVAQASATYTDADINLGSLTIPEEGDYTFILTNSTANSGAILEKITLSYVGGAVQAMPGTTDVDDAWFSSNGTRTAGEYISIPTGHQDEGWVKWNVSFAETANYNVTVNIENENGHNYTVALYTSELDENPITLSEGSQKSTIGTLELGAMEVPAGNYILKVTNAVQWSDAKLISVQFVYAGGGTIDIPGTITLSDAILSTRAYMDGDDLHFTDADHLGTISGEWAKWNINVAADGIFTFTANCNASNYSHMKISVMDEDENVLFTHQTQWSFSTATSVVTPEWFLEAGNYILKAENPADWSDGYLTSLSAAQVANILIVDENATDMAYINEKNGLSMKPLLKRSFRSGMFNTVCFPFNGVTAGELESIFGAGYVLLEMSSAALADNVLTLNFSTVDLSGDTYGRPYLIKPTQDVVNPLFNSHTIYKSTSHLVVNGDNANFVGSFIKGTVPAGEDYLFLGANDLLYFSEEATTIKGMRAYFQIHDVPSGAPIRQARIVEHGNVVTALEFVNGEWQEIKSGNGTIKTIENGQLILIRDGKRYNVMGIRF